MADHVACPPCPKCGEREHVTPSESIHGFFYGHCVTCGNFWRHDPAADAGIRIVPAEGEPKAEEGRGTRSSSRRPH